MQASTVFGWVISTPPDPIKVSANHTFDMTGYNATQRKIMEKLVKYPGKLMEKLWKSLLVIWQKP